MLYVALIPSCQNNRGLGDYVEGEAMRKLADHAREFANSLEGVEAENWWFGLDSPPDFPLLVRQLSEAQDWLDQRTGPGSITLAINIHTDSGKPDDPEWPHVIGAYRREADNKSWRLASICARQVEDILNTDEVLVWDYTGYMFDKLMPNHTTCLIEAGNHQSPHCMQVLGNEVGLKRIAEAIVRGCLEYAELEERPKQPSIDWQARSQRLQDKLDRLREILDE